VGKIAIVSALQAQFAKGGHGVVALLFGDSFFYVLELQARG
jgi:hypothetical protein